MLHPDAAAGGVGGEGHPHVQRHAVQPLGQFQDTRLRAEVGAGVHAPFVRQGVGVADLLVGRQGARHRAQGARHRAAAADARRAGDHSRLRQRATRPGAHDLRAARTNRPGSD